MNMKKNFVSLFTWFGLALLHYATAQQKAADKFLQNYNVEIVKLVYDYKKLRYKVFTDSTPEHERALKEGEGRYTKRLKEYQIEAWMINLTNVDENSKRQLMFIRESLTSKYEYINKNLFDIKRRMEKAFLDAGMTGYHNISRKLGLGELNEIISRLNGSSEDKLDVWKGFRDSLGPKVREDYIEFVRLKNIAARENGYSDAGEFKRQMYEVDNLEEIAEKFWLELKPFYAELHAYVRYRLNQKYADHIKKDDAMPAHLLGNMWALAWDDIFDDVKPYPNEPELDFSSALRKKLDNTTMMFKMTEDFFKSIGWPMLPSNFWENSVLTPPMDGKKVNCYPTAWDMFGKVKNKQDVRLIMCAGVNNFDFITAHHEVGHLYYALLYSDLPFQFREGANPAFHEAVGDTLALSAQVPQHLYNVGILDNVSNTEEQDINYLLKTASQTVAFMPYAYILDKWVWNVYNGNIKPNEMNKKWWELRLKYQGIKPPIERSENDFDPATKYQLTADVPFIRYFFAVILQFTFHKYACKAAGHTGHLHQCSIYNSTEAGKAFGDMLKLGRSKPWPEQLKQFTGSEELSADPVLDYFAPLRSWLKKEQEKYKYPVGWANMDPDGQEVKSERPGSNGCTLLVNHMCLFLSFLFTLCMTAGVK